MFVFQTSKEPKEFRDRKIKTFWREIEPQEILLDSLAQKKDIRISEKKMEVPLSQKMLKVLFAVFFISIFFLLAKSFQLQILERNQFLAQAQENKFIIASLGAERGVIYDRNLNQLVFNRPAYNLICQKSQLPKEEREKEGVLKQLSQILEEDLESLKIKISETQDAEVLISQNLSHQTLIVLETKIKEWPGFQVRQNSKRDYQAQAFSHLLGYTGKITAPELKEDLNYSIFDWTGKQGLEKSYEKILRKNPGKLRIERDALGKEISKEIVALPESGKSLVLWLDSDLQIRLSEVLERKLKELGVEKGAAVVLEPDSGGVLALVSLPDFNNNLFNTGSDPEALQYLLEDPLSLNPLFNRAISGQYLMGSTIKPLIASAALEEKIISPQTNINCQGEIVIENPWYDPDHPELGQEAWVYHDWTVHGWTDLRKAIAQSCNIYFYTVGGGYGEQEGLGPSRIKDYLQLFGWGERTGIDLPEETSGFIPDPAWKERVKEEKWWDGDTYHLSIGQGDILATPLQIAAAFSAIANGGKLYQPQVVKEILDSEKNPVQEITPKILRENFVDEKNLQIVREGMREAVTYGSSVSLNDLPVKAAAKTGTAQTSQIDYYHHWVTVFAPYENPQIVLTIVIESVKGVQFAALPVAKEVLNWYFSQSR